MQPKISVIVPVYNVEKYLNKCIESIVNQTYRNLEIILVDDGSPDNCPQMCDEWAKKDDRIIVIHKENGGLSDARNKGLDIATGEYIGFVDSDDWIDLDLYECFVSKFKKNNASIIACNVVKVYEDKIEKNINEVKKEVYNVEEALNELIHGRTFRAVVWNKLYHKNTINKIRFPYGKTHEDEFFTYKVLSNANKLIYVPNKFYYYRQRSGSIMNLWSTKHLDVLEAFNERLYFLKQNYSNLYILDKYTFFNFCLYCCDLILTELPKVEICENINKVFKYYESIQFNLSELKRLGIIKTLKIYRGKVLYIIIKYKMHKIGR